MLASTVALAGAGDEAAFSQLVAAYHADMARVAFVACGDRELAEDAVQSAWLVAWKKLHSLRDPDRVRPWLLAVTANEARQLLRRRHGPVLRSTSRSPATPGVTRRTASSASTSVVRSGASRPMIAPSWPCTTSSTSARTSSGRLSAPRRQPPAPACPGPSTVSGRSSAMAERDRFETDLADALRAYAESAPTQVRPTELARHFATAYPHRRTLFGAWRPIALAPPSAVARSPGSCSCWRACSPRWSAGCSSSARRRSGTHGRAAAGRRAVRLPARVTPDEPGPVDQARPPDTDDGVRPPRRQAGGPRRRRRRARRQTWTFDVCTNTWTRMHPDREPPRLEPRVRRRLRPDDRGGRHERVPRRVGLRPRGQHLDRARDRARRTRWGSTTRCPASCTAEHGTTTSRRTRGPRPPGEGRAATCASTTPPSTGSSCTARRRSPPRCGSSIRTGVWKRSDAETPDCTTGSWGYPAVVYDEAAERTVVSMVTAGASTTRRRTAGRSSTSRC